MNDVIVYNEKQIHDRIHTIRNQQVILDRDIAELYNVTTGNLNKAVKRNIERFPENFMFQLTKDESLIFQTSSGRSEHPLRFQNGSLEKGRGKHRKYLPFAFTEQGVAMLSGVLRSDTAIRVSIQIINTFVAMRKFISSNAQVFYRLDNVERKQIEHDRKFEQVFYAIESRGIKPEKGIFFDGQVFDAYKFVSDLIRSADKSIILIDNYVDDTVLNMLCSRKKGVVVKIFTQEVSSKLQQDVAKCNAQYPTVEIRKFVKSHDRFLILDKRDIYHIGASLKDLGKKWFAFSKLEREVFEVLDRLEELS